MKALLQAMASIWAVDGPPPLPVNFDLEKLRQLALFIVKGSVTIAFIIVFLASFIRGIVGAIERSGGGSFMGSSGYREMIEAFKGPVIFLLVLLLMAWLPDILSWIGILPPALKAYVIDWRSLFGG